MSQDNKTVPVEANGPEAAVENKKAEAKKDNGPPVSIIVAGIFRTIAIEENDVSFANSLTHYLLDREIKTRLGPSA